MKKILLKIEIHILKNKRKSLKFSLAIALCFATTKLIDKFKVFNLKRLNFDGKILF
jgi:hypothetical protein